MNIFTKAMMMNSNMFSESILYLIISEVDASSVVAGMTKMTSSKNMMLTRVFLILRNLLTCFSARRCFSILRYHESFVT